MHHSRRQSMTVSNQLGKPRLSEQRLAADLQAFQQSGGAIERLGDTPLRREKAWCGGSCASRCSCTGRRSQGRVNPRRQQASCACRVSDSLCNMPIAARRLRGVHRERIALCSGRLAQWSPCHAGAIAIGRLSRAYRCIHVGAASELVRCQMPRGCLRASVRGHRRDAT